MISFVLNYLDGFLSYFSMISPTISYISHKTPLISVTLDIKPDYAYDNTSDTRNSWYLCHMISQIWWYLSLYHGTCTEAWLGLEAPGARSSTSFDLAIANVLNYELQVECSGPSHFQSCSPSWPLTSASCPVRKPCVNWFTRRLRAWVFKTTSA